jgi:hypothetical protein
VPFQDSQHSLGNSMAEFQQYGGELPYYHGGLDLRVAPAQAVHSAVAGRVEAGHYGYTNHPDGSMTKYWAAWPGDGDPTYFEVAVITDDGYRFEHHHMDETRLPDAIVTALKNGGRVAAGDLLGQTILWPDGDYNHTHINIITPSGVNLNPEYYYPLIADHSAPELQAAFAVDAVGKATALAAGATIAAPDHFAVVTLDRKDDDVYVQLPVYAGVSFASGASSFWDFRERLAGPDGKFPGIWDFFVQSLTDQDGKEWDTSGGYGDGVSVIRLPMPARNGTPASGPFTIQLGDEAGNITQLKGTIQQ